MSKKLRKWCNDSVEESMIASQLRMLAMYADARDSKAKEVIALGLSEAECKALKDLRDSIQREIDLFCPVIA
jgi:hypothetical protein